ncbi:MAG: hypothetical protein QOH71_399 [Blastocatellia bacterium]|jgi:hypothetical protein|nr:hypothetical protein [Blastocatellia bacterium]
MSGGKTINMSSEAVTARIRRTCELNNFARALASARSAAARAKADRPRIKEEPQPKEAEISKPE